MIIIISQKSGPIVITRVFKFNDEKYLPAHLQFSVYLDLKTVVTFSRSFINILFSSLFKEKYYHLK